MKESCVSFTGCPKQPPFQDEALGEGDCLRGEDLSLLCSGVQAALPSWAQGQVGLISPTSTEKVPVTKAQKSFPYIFGLAKKFAVFPNILQKNTNLYGQPLKLCAQLQSCIHSKLQIFTRFQRTTMFLEFKFLILVPFLPPIRHVFQQRCSLWKTRGPGEGTLLVSNSRDME